MLLTIFKKSFILPVWLGYEYGSKRNIANVKTTIIFESHISFGFWGFKASGIYFRVEEMMELLLSSKRQWQTSTEYRWFQKWESLWQSYLT